MGLIMAEFVNPFSGLAPGRKLTERELTRALRMCLAAEEEAVHLYEAVADAANDPATAEMLQDIANEERVHIGEFQKLIDLILPDEQELLKQGGDEVDNPERIAKEME